MRLQGADGLKRRLEAVQHVQPKISRGWAEATIEALKPNIPVRTGKGRASLKVASADDDGAEITALDYVAILDQGAAAHDIMPSSASVLRFDVEGRTQFAPKVHKPQQRGLGFAVKAATEGFRRAPMSDAVIDAWNRAD